MSKMAMANSPHPGEIIKELCLEPLGLTITQAAQGLGVTRKILSLVLNEHDCSVKRDLPDPAPLRTFGQLVHPRQYRVPAEGGRAFQCPEWK